MQRPRADLGADAGQRLAGRWRLSADRAPWLLGAIALALYIPGIWWGVPHATDPNLVRGWNVDGMAGLWTLAEFHNLLVQGKSDWYLAYPLFHFLVLGLSYAPYLAYLLLTGGVASPSAEYPYGFVDPVGSLARLVLIGRGVTVAMACGAVIAACVAARTVWDRTTGIVAAGVVMMASPMFYYARMGNPDVPVLFWSALGLIVVACIVRGGLTISRGVWLGIFAALAVATKDQAFGVWVPAITLLIYLHWQHFGTGAAIRQRQFWAPPGSIVLAGGAAYALASGLVFSPARFLGHMDFMLNFGQRAYNVALLGLMKPMTPTNLTVHLFDIGAAVVEALGPILLAAALVGFALTWRSDRFTTVLAVMAVGYVLLSLVPAMHMMLRYSILLAFLLAFPAARAIVLGWRDERFRPVAIGVLALGFAWLGLRGADLTYQLLFDARWDAGRWLASQARPGDTVGYFGDQAQLPVMPNGVTPMLIPMTNEDAFLRQQRPDFVLVIPDWSSGPGMVGSRALPDAVFKNLEDGSLGYQRAIRLRTAPLWRDVYGDLLPQINPPVQIFALSGSEASKP